MKTNLHQLARYLVKHASVLKVQEMLAQSRAAGLRDFHLALRGAADKHYSQSTDAFARALHGLAASQ